FIESWHNVGVMTHVGYIIGFPFDTPESVREDIRRLKEEVKVDHASFFMLTPLPGSRDHLEMLSAGKRMDPDLNKFDSFHVVMDHPLMTSEEWLSAYNEAWESFYTFDNVRNILMRAGQHLYWGVFKNYMWYKNSLLEPRHPMVAGFVRKKHRKDIRPGTPVMGFLKFQVRRASELFGGFRKRISLFLELEELWFLTRKPQDPTFRFVADFAAVVNETKQRIGALDPRRQYSKLREEINTACTHMREKINHHSQNADISGKLRRRYEALIDDMGAQMEKIAQNEQYARSVSHITAYLNKTVQIVEELSLKQVKRRRKITRYWKLTMSRIREGNVFRFLLSTPKLTVNFLKDIRMSTYFLFHLLNGGFSRHK
ncbi:MAG: hypothetical protein ACYC9O_19485, partial [Candidatus Latescibacterota bacterium]